jgi:hypothetical protein
LITAGTHTTIQNCDVAPGAGSPAGQDSYAVGIRAAGGGSTLVENCNFENYTSNAFLVITSPANNPFSTYFVVRNTAVGAPYYGYTPTGYSMVVTNAYVAVENTIQGFASAVSSTNNIGVLEYNDSCNPAVISDLPFPVLFISPWPTAPTKPGDMYLGNSNGWIYMLTSGPGSSGWTKTNLIATP